MTLRMTLEVVNDASDTQLIIKTGGFFHFIVFVTLSSLSLISAIPQNKVNALSEVVLS